MFTDILDDHGSFNGRINKDLSHAVDLIQTHFPINTEKIGNVQSILIHNTY